MINVQFNDKAKQVLADTLDLSGSKVVNELPQVGEEHTIYELQEISKGSYGWMFTVPFIDTSESSINLVFDTYEQMTTTMNEVKVVEGNTYPKCFLAYIRNTNQMYMLSPVFTDHPHWEFRELPKKDDESGTDYAFEVKYTEDKGSAVVHFQYTYYIIKEFVANERPKVDGGFEYSGITLDDKEVYVLGSGKLFGVLNNITYPRFTMLFTNFFGYPGTFTYDKLPNSVELETKCYNLLRSAGTYGFNNVQFAVYNTTNNAYYLLNPKTTAYQWYNNLEDRENCYFAQSGDYEGEPPHYIGELEWMYSGSFDDYLESELKSLAFNEIPYNDMINHNPPFNSSGNVSSDGCAFQPKKGGEVTSYWIYSNGEWVNVDDMSTKPPLHRTVYGTLTDVEGSVYLSCSLTIDEIVNNFNNGYITILEYKPTVEGSDYYYCAISNVQEHNGNYNLTPQPWSLGSAWIDYDQQSGFFLAGNGEA